MNEMTRDRIGSLDWEKHSRELDAYGYTILEKLIDPDTCRALIAHYDDPDAFRSHIHMARHGFGRGEYKYFAYPLPDIIADLR